MWYMASELVLIRGVVDISLCFVGVCSSSDRADRRLLWASQLVLHDAFLGERGQRQGRRVRVIRLRDALHVVTIFFPPRRP